jgi:hypothetical protein
VARYRYEPDIELRWFVCDRPDLLDVELDSWSLFDSWRNLEAELMSGEWKSVFRAAAAFRAAAEQREPEVDGELVLAAAIGGTPFTAQAAASQLADVATVASRDAIEQALAAAAETGKNVETRVDLRRALERIDMNSFTRR